MEIGKITHAKSWMAYMIGLCIVQFGVAIFLDLNIGSDPFTVFMQGIARTFKVTPGMANRILTIAILMILVCYDRKYINIGTLISIIGVGVILDGMLRIIAPVELENLSIGLKIIMFIIGCMIIAIGFPIIKLSGLGLAPNDIVYMAIVEHLHKPYGMVRMSVDAIYLVIGFLMHGVVGIGTVICIVCLGPIMEFFMNHLEKHIIKVLE